MANDSRLHLQLGDGHLRVVPQGDLTECKIRQILRAAEVGLHVFPLVVVDLLTSRGLTASALNLLEEGLQQIIAKRKEVLLKPQRPNPGNNTSFSSPAAVGPAKDKAPPNQPNRTDILAAPSIRLIINPSGLSPQG